jgi:hypothetical protein
MTGRRVALSVFCLALAVSAWVLGDGPAGWLYLFFYGLAILPGLPIGFALFGREHAGGWIAGASVGYALTAFAIWISIAARIPSALAFGVAWACVSGLTWFFLPKAVRPLVTLPAWTPAASAALLLVLVLTLAVAIPPLAHVGRTDDEGNRYYRAYFTADFVWHTALTSEIAKFSMPPRNPYLARQPIHYYWTYYLLPAAVSEAGPAPVRDVQLCLKVNALMTGLLLISAVFLSAWTVVGRAIPSAVGTALALVASSAEGIFQTFKLWARGVPLSELRNWNIDAVTAWPPFGGHRIDGLQRCLWYVPQHSMAYALGVIALVVAAASGSTAPLAAIALGGIALGCSVAFNPFVGGIFALAYGLSIIGDAWHRPRAVHTIARHGVAVIPVAIAVAWCASNQMVEGAGGFLQFGFLGASRQHPIVTLLLSLGPILVAGLAGLLPSRAVPLTPAMPFLVLVVISLFLMYFVRLSVDQAWVAFRAGQMLIIALAALAARFVASGGTGRRRTLTGAVILVCLAGGIPTTAIDEYNAQDTHNLAMGPGFPWTIVVSRQQLGAYRWIRENTAPNAIVQMDARSRERSTWSNIPSFAERRMAGGLPISLLNVPEYAERSDRIRAMYAAHNPAEAADLARNLRIDYVYVDEVERRAYPQGIQFANSPVFEKAFEDPPVAVYRVR